MPIIGQARIQDTGRVSRGVLVDKDGYFVARVQWTGKRPVINNNTVPATERKRLVTLDKNPNAANIPSESARWDFVALDWVAPTDEFVLVKASTGEAVKRFKGFRERLPDYPEGYIIVDDPMPKVRNYKPIYDVEDQAWVEPRRVAVLNAGGEVINVVLENPNEAAPNYEPAEGETVVRPAKGEKLPKDEDNVEIGIGYKLDKGKWVKKSEPPTT